MSDIKERPILFSAEMVRAILENRKTQTRRIIKPQPVECHHKHDAWIWRGHHTEFDSLRRLMEAEWCPYGQSGDRLWVKETWRPVGPWECRKDGATIQYRADQSYERKTGWPPSYRISTRESRDKWKSSRFMPRWASRITLEITSIRVERLRDISDEDAVAEGTPDTPIIHYYCDEGDPNDPEDFGTHRCNWRFGYKDVWESINGKGSWDLNPWVWAITFKSIPVL